MVNLFKKIFLPAWIEAEEISTDICHGTVWGRGRTTLTSREGGGGGEGEELKRLSQL